MLFFLLDVAIVGGATYTGVKAYQQQRQRHKPLVLLLTASDSEALQVRETPPSPVVSGNDQQGAKRDVLARLLDGLYTTGEGFTTTYIAPLFSRAQRAGTPDWAAEQAIREVTEEERQMNRNIALSLLSLGLAVGGAVVPGLQLLSIPGLLFLSGGFLRQTYVELVYERRIGMFTMAGLFSLGAIATGSWLSYSIFCSIYSATDKIILHTRTGVAASLMDVFGEMPQTAWVVRDGNEVELSLDQIEAGDMLVVNSGGMIPVDGVIDHGLATIDQRMLTGEAQPAEKGEGDHVFAATVVMAGRIYVRIEKTGTETLTAQIGQILEKTTDYRSSTMLRGTQIANATSLPVIILSGLTLPFMGLNSAVAVLLAHFGYDVRFTAPIAVLNYLQVAARNHMLVKDGRALEELRKVDTVVFDKTGTLTQEQPHVKTIHPCVGFNDTDVLRYAAAAEYRQPHPFAHAILHAAAEQGIDIPEIDLSSYEVGFGVRVRFEEQLLCVGSARFMEREGVPLPADIQALQSHCYEQGHSLVYVALDQRLCGTIELRPTIRPEATQIIHGLKQRGMQIYVISGDHKQPTRQLANDLGITNYFAEVLPQHKSALIEQLQQEGRTVCFVGDGINDSIALKQADVSISLRGASSIATDMAQVILMDGSLRQLNTLFDLAHDLDASLNVSLAAGVIPCLISLSGIYLFSFNIAVATVVDAIGLAVGVSNGLLPLWRYQTPDVPSLPDGESPPASPPRLEQTLHPALPA